MKLPITTDVPSDTHVVILIDALNQMDETDHAHGMNWLPTKLPSHVKVVASCIDDPEKQEKVLEAFEHRQYHHIKIEPLTGNGHNHLHISRLPRQ